MESKIDSWIDSVVSRCNPISHEHPLETELAELLIAQCYENHQIANGKIGRLLASAFDLLVSAQYYSALSHTGWLYCPTDTPRLYFHYTNCCPRDVLTDSFHFHPSNKPESGKIGTATARLLLLFYQVILKRHGFEETILRGTEPVDAIIVNKKRKKVLFAEIKASPLVTLPIAASSERLTAEIEGEAVERKHSSTDNSKLFNSPLDIFVPKNKSGKWVERYFRIGERKDAGDRQWGFRGIINLLKKDPSFLKEYFHFWDEALNAYHPKLNRTIFWLTNACGTPVPLPQGWAKRRRGDGFESISDSKTSVGMDRTDDIKKGIYQVLKLGSLGKPCTSKWDYKVGIISNIHAARHFDEYLESLRDIIWTLDTSGRAKRISDLPANQNVYNLFDGIIALTSTLSRDEWIDSVFVRISKNHG
jgi:hypothetical protein